MKKCWKEPLGSATQVRAPGEDGQFTDRNDFGPLLASNGYLAWGDDTVHLSGTQKENACSTNLLVSFDSATAQTPGVRSTAAIHPGAGINSPIWGGLFLVEPGARIGIHHHGKQHTIVYVLSGQS
jgi:hypothetical protein